MADLKTVRKKVAKLKTLKILFQKYRDTAPSKLARKFNALINEVTVYIYRAKFIDCMDEFKGDFEGMIDAFIRDVDAFEQRMIELLGLDAQSGGN